MATSSLSIASVAQLKSKLAIELPNDEAVLVSAMTVIATKFAPVNDLRTSKHWKMNRRGNRPHVDVHILMRDIAKELARLKRTTALGELAPIRGSYDEQIAAGARQPCDADRITRVILKVAGMPHFGSLRQQAAAARKLLQ